MRHLIKFFFSLEIKKSECKEPFLQETVHKMKVANSEIDSYHSHLLEYTKNCLLISKEDTAANIK